MTENPAPTAPELPSHGIAPAVLRSIQVGRPAEHGIPGAESPMDRPWTSAIVKRPVAGPVALRRTNLDGDGQADPVHHGGPDKAVCVYSADHDPAWRAELGLDELPPGAFGENFTVAGLVESGVCIGDIWRVGSAVVEVSQPRQPCWKLARRWRIKDLAARVQASGRTGWYFRVREEGEVAPGQPLELLERPSPAWSIARANDVMHRLKGDRALASELAAAPGLSTSWRETLARRAGEGAAPDARARLEGPA